MFSLDFPVYRTNSRPTSQRWRKGEHSQVDEKNRDNKILEARLTGAKLTLKIAGNGNEDQLMRAAVELTRRTSAEATRGSSYFNLLEVV